MNVLMVAGRVGRNAELRHTSSDKQVANFSLAVDEYAGHGERKTLWIDCALWGERAAKLSIYLTKGTPVAVSGQVGIRTYESNGETRAALTLRVADVTLLGSKNEVERAEPSKAQAKPAARQAPPPDDFEDSEIPF